MDKELDLVVETDGTVRFVYDDDLAAAFAGEELHTVRASHVEPAADFGIAGGGWIADMRPSGGPLLGAADLGGFPTRQAALDAERRWLREHKGL